MANTTFNGPVRSENGFQKVAKDATTGEVSKRSLHSNPNKDTLRYYLEEWFLQRPALNADIDQVYTVEVARAASKDFEVLGTNMTTALCTFTADHAGITITTATADEDQAIIAPHLDTNQTAWTGVKWGTENSVIWECAVSTNAIDNQKVWAGLKLTNDQLVATDDDQAYFLFETDGDNGTSLDDYTLLHFVHSIGGTDYISALPITVAANTTYRLRIDIDSDRKASIFVNGVQYSITSTAGSTGGTAVTKGTTKSAALTDDVDLIPYIGIECGAAAAEALDVHYQAISRLIFE